MKRILLVTPVPVEFNRLQDMAFLRLPFVKQKALLPPLQMGTIAGLTPDDEMDELLALENYIPVARLGDQKKLGEGGGGD